MTTKQDWDPLTALGAERLAELIHRQCMAITARLRELAEEDSAWAAGSRSAYRHALSMIVDPLKPRPLPTLEELRNNFEELSRPVRSK